MKAKIKTAFAEFKITTVRVMEEPKTECDTPQNYLDLWKKHVAAADWYDEDKECLVVFTLNTKLQVKCFHLISLGTINETTVSIADILKPVIISSAYGFVLAHNHPSGDPAPSQADKNLTRRLKESADTMGCRMLDHVIVGDRYFSFRECGLI